MPAKEDIIASLLLERESFRRLGDKENEAAVEAELEFYGFEPKAPAKRAEKRPAAAKEER